ncbi:NAD(P)/FAD-dependent oxidoreductase [Nocardia sp. NPDC003482]
MTHRYDCIVIGGGVAGLMTAARLAARGIAVALLEGDRLGAGATTRNHGMVHSGAMYARWHPEIVAACRRAQSAYRASFPECVSGIETCWYIGKPDTMAEYEARWRHHDIAAHGLDAGQLREVLSAAPAAEVHGRAVREVFIDTHRLIIDLAARCVASNVAVLVGVSGLRVEAGPDGVRGVETAAGFLSSPNVVSCNGMGAHELLARSESVVSVELSSRLEMMMAFPGELPCAITGLEFGWPAVAPSAAGGAVLASWYGAPQRFVHARARWPVPAADTAELAAVLRQWLRPGLIDTSAGVGWMCSKTEHTRGRGDQWGTEPDFAVIDHGARDGIAGWWTVLPGKMTLALHASQAVVTAIARDEEPLPLPGEHDGCGEDVAELVEISPWRAHCEAVAR